MAEKKDWILVYDDSGKPDVTDALKQLQTKFDELQARIESMDETLAALAADAAYGPSWQPPIYGPGGRVPKEFEIDEDLKRALENVDMDKLAVELESALADFMKKK